MERRGEVASALTKELRRHAARWDTAGVSGKVVAVSISAAHSFSKLNRTHIRLVEGHGVQGDAHAGEKVKHRSRVARDPNQPNLRQVHLLQSELLDELCRGGYEVAPGDVGENITTRGTDLLALPIASRLRLGDTAVVEVTGLRNPCVQLDWFQPGLMSAVLDRGPDGELIRKAGIMGIVIVTGEVVPGDPITIELPPHPHQPLEPV